MNFFCPHFSHYLEDPYVEPGYERDPLKDQIDVAIIGGGFGGMLAGARFQELGVTDFRIIESGGDFGGTWYWNRYPGARCDIPSMEYSYQFSEELQQEWAWTERYATQPEILKYAEHVVERFGLGDDIQFETRVTSTVFNDENSSWVVQLDSAQTVVAKYVVMATGCLSVPNFPSIDGLDNFKGPVYHTGLWPHEGVDFKDKKVAVIGTGSSCLLYTSPSPRD